MQYEHFGNFCVHTNPLSLPYRCSVGHSFTFCSFSNSMMLLFIHAIISANHAKLVRWNRIIKNALALNQILHTKNNEYGCYIKLFFDICQFYHLLRFAVWLHWFSVCTIFTIMNVHWECLILAKLELLWQLTDRMIFWWFSAIFTSMTLPYSIKIHKYTHTHTQFERLRMSSIRAITTTTVPISPIQNPPPGFLYYHLGSFARNPFMLFWQEELCCSGTIEPHECVFRIYNNFAESACGFCPLVYWLEARYAFWINPRACKKQNSKMDTP